MGLGVSSVHVESIEPTYLREYLRRDSEHARVCAVRLAMHSHGVTLHYNTTRPLPCLFELGGFKSAHLHYADVTYGYTGAIAS